MTCPRILHLDLAVKSGGGAIYRKVPLTLENVADYPHLKKFMQNKFLAAITEYKQGGDISLSEINFILLRVVADEKSDIDENQRMHVDTFHSTTKGWLYLDDVEPKDGPLTYLAGSNVINSWRLKFEYRNSRKYESTGSWRISPEESEKVFGKELSFTVPANTLVIADTMGFHRRGDAEKGIARDTIHFTARKSPFFK